MVCGVEREDTFHALCRCPREWALWLAMAEEWDMPKLDDIANTGLDWLLHLLNRCNEHVRLPLIMTLWRSWHVRNEITHDKPAPPVEASRRFLSGYIDTILGIQQHPIGDFVKEKMMISRMHTRKEKLLPAHGASPRPLEAWRKPPSGSAKSNVDGSFLQADGTGGAGMILRDSEGAIIFASCRYLRVYDNAREAELEVIREGIQLTLEWSTLPFNMESDCTTVLEMIRSNTQYRSPIASLVGEIKRLLGLGREHALSV